MNGNTPNNQIKRNPKDFIIIVVVCCCYWINNESVKRYKIYSDVQSQQANALYQTAK
jgi:hypothetical protein